MPLPRALSALWLATVLADTAHAQPLSDTKSLRLHVRDGTAVMLSQAQFTPQPGTVMPDDPAWLEHCMLFLFKTPSEFGAKLRNGVYYQLKATGNGFGGLPQAVDLNRISAPPGRPGVPPLRRALRDDIAPGARWFHLPRID